jgi:tetratricopeptide (TPR) repeat protein
VLACAERCAEYWGTDKAAEERSTATREQAFARHLCGIGYELEKDYRAAKLAYRAALKIYRGLNAVKDVAGTFNDIAEIERRIGDYKAAERDYRRALRIARKLDHRESVATYTGNLAGLALHRSHWAEAEQLARKALVLSEGVGRQELIAADCRRLAQALARQNRRGEGLPHAPAPWTFTRSWARRIWKGRGKSWRNASRAAPAPSPEARPAYSPRNGSHTTSRSSIRCPCCRSSEYSVPQPASSAAATIIASYRAKP